MTWTIVATVLWVALLLAHLIELRRIGAVRAERAAHTKREVDQCLANIDHVIDLRGLVAVID